MRKLLLATTALAALVVTPALAADMAAPVYKAPPPPAPVWSWTGFYIGVNAGWKGINSAGMTSAPNDAATVGFNTACIAAGACPQNYGNASGNGFIGGGQVGYNWQIQNYVVWRWRLTLMAPARAPRVISQSPRRASFHLTAPNRPAKTTSVRCAAVSAYSRRPRFWLTSRAVMHTAPLIGVGPEAFRDLGRPGPVALPTLFRAGPLAAVSSGRWVTDSCSVPNTFTSGLMAAIHS